MSDIPLWSIVLLGIVWITALVLWPERKKYDKSAKSSSAVIELNECADVRLERNEFVGERLFPKEVRRELKKEPEKIQPLFIGPKRTRRAK